MVKICFITAIYGNYEATCKRFAKQTVETDFVCFTDNGNICSNGWTIDTTPYHLTNKSELDDDTYINSISNNKHTFNIAKYYKENFQNIPFLKEYDIVTWLDGTVEIISDKVSEFLINNIYKHKIITWEHNWRNGSLANETQDSISSGRYTTTMWNNQVQPFQDVAGQYNSYVEDGYIDSFFKDIFPDRQHIGVWVTCFVAFLNKDETVKKFLDLWYMQNLKYTTQDQISFPYVCQKLNLIPYTLPNNQEVSGDFESSTFHIKHGHGK
jgi:hypothetical protein